MPDPATRTGYLLWQCAHSFTRVMNDALAPFDLTPAQFAALVHVTREPGVSAAELARRVNLTPQSMQTALAPLLHRKLIERRRHPVHRRVLTLFPAELTADLVTGANAAVQTADDNMAPNLGEQDRETLRGLLRRTLESLSPAALDRTSLRTPTPETDNAAREGSPACDDSGRGAPR